MTHEELAHEIVEALGEYTRSLEGAMQGLLKTVLPEEYKSIFAKDGDEHPAG